MTTAAPPICNRLLGPDLHGSAGGGAGPGLIEEIRRAGLRGRGGGGFPTWRKMAAVAEAGRPAVVVANGCEGEPASRKDALLLMERPGLVLDGARVAAGAVGAREVIVAVPRGRPEIARAVRAAARGRDGVTVREVPSRFVTGEETALASALGGGRGLPTRGRRPSSRGVGGRPTLIQNVETLAHVGLIAARGAGWFRQAGTEDEPGTMLVTVAGGRVVEIEIGTPVAEVLARAGHDPRPGAVLAGGYGGAWVAAADPAAVPLSREGMRAAGATPGAGVLLPLPSGCCGLAETARLARWLAGESAGQCGPCARGLPELAARMEDLALRRDPGAALAEVHALLALVEGRGACAHPDGVARLVLSAIRAFPGELDLHMHGGCRAPGHPPAFPLPGRA